jgi:predicted amidophosphoribosyltransferase
MFRDLADDLLAVLLPGRCPGCGARGEPVCDACAAALPGAPPGRAVPGVSWSVAVFAYEGVARELVARVKYRNERVAVKWLARQLAAHLAICPTPFDTITWVPGSAQRCATRGVDHGALLARAVARACGATATQLLRREPGPPQTGRPAVDRRAGPLLHASAHAAGRVVLVVDDVVTTGGTLAAAARALRAQGARDVIAATVARTPRPGYGSRPAAYTPIAV